MGNGASTRAPRGMCRVVVYAADNAHEKHRVLVPTDWLEFLSIVADKLGMSDPTALKVCI